MRVTTVLFLGICSMSPSKAADYPERPIEVIVPFNAGGGSDVFVRLFQKAFRDADVSDQPLVVRNVGGAGGTIGSRQAKDAKPDGYTIMCLHDGIYTAQHYGNADWGPADFEPIAATGRSGVVVAVSDSSEFESLDQLMSRAVERPYELVYGTNLGAPNHYSALFLQEGKEGARFRFTQTGGGARRLAQLKGGHVDVTGFSVAEFLQFQGAGIRALAVLSREREAALPDVPTALEQDVDALHELTQYWWAPKGTPEAVVDEIARMLDEAMQSEGLKAQLDRLYIEPIFLRGEALEGEIDERRDHLAGLVIEDAVSLPPLHWIVLGGVLLCGIAVWREGKGRETA